MSLYATSNWPTPDKQRDPSAATPVGSSTATASVSSGNIAFGSVADGDYWAYASVGGNKVYRLVHVGGPDPSGDIAHYTADGTFSGAVTFSSDPTIPSLPSAGQKLALAGTSGTPGSANKFVTEALPTITAPTLTGTWVNFGAPYRNCGYYKVGPLVYLGGVVKCTGAETTIFTLPAGFRPSASVFTRASTSAGAGTDLTISGAGVVSVGSAIYTYVSLDCIRFLAEA